MTALGYAYFRDTLMLLCLRSKNKVPVLITRSTSPKTGLMQRRIKGVYLDPRSLPFVSSWFVLMWEPNPAKADYTCIKFLKIAVFLIPHLQWKCNGSSLQKYSPPSPFPGTKLSLWSNKGFRHVSKMNHVNENDVVEEDIVTQKMYIFKKSTKNTPPTRRKKKSGDCNECWHVQCVYVCSLCTVARMVEIKIKRFSNITYVTLLNQYNITLPFPPSFCCSQNSPPHKNPRVD